MTKSTQRGLSVVMKRDALLKKARTSWTVKPIGADVLGLYLADILIARGSVFHQKTMASIAVTLNKNAALAASLQDTQQEQHHGD